MGSVQSKKRSAKVRVMKRHGIVTRKEYESLELDSRLSLIKALVPLGMMLVTEELQREVDELAGAHYARKGDERKRVYRHGRNPGSVKLAGQRVGIEVPRVRAGSKEVKLRSYERLHGETGELNETLFQRVLHGLSTRNYESAAEAVPGAIGLSKTTVSREFIEASGAQLKALQERDLSEQDIVAIFLDGKRFADAQMVIALGVTRAGNKVFLGFVETDTENKKVVTAFLRSLLSRGLCVSRGIMAILDGSKGLRSAVCKAFAGYVLVQRCQWHKRENVVAYLPKQEQALMRKRLQRAYQKPTHHEAKASIELIEQELEQSNQDAMGSLQEGLEETLTLHRLGVFALLGRSFKTTNCLESVNAACEEKCQRIDYWKNSSQRQRWLAASLLDIEPRLNKVAGFAHLDTLQTAIAKELNLSEQPLSYKQAA